MNKVVDYIFFTDKPGRELEVDEDPTSREVSEVKKRVMVGLSETEYGEYMALEPTKRGGYLENKL